MEKIRQLLIELRFVKKSSDPYGGSKVICWDSLPEPADHVEKWVKSRHDEEMVMGMFMMMVAISGNKVLVQACQIVGSDDTEKDKRIKDGGLLWFTNVFDDLDEACKHIKYAADEVSGPLYGPTFPPPA